jgi:hypothetical protein
MKKHVVDYIDTCLECHKVKAKNRHPPILLQPFPLKLEWKWEVVKIDFITKLPKTMKQHDSIMELVDKITKLAHFLVVKLTHKVSILQIFI